MKNQFTLIVSFCIAALVFQRCGDSKKPATADTGLKTDSVSAPYQLSIETHKAEEGGCKSDDCTHIRLEIPVLKGGDQKVCDAINQFTQDEIREAVKSRLPEPQGNISLDAMCESFIEGYKLFLLEFPDSEQKWYLEILGDSSIVGDDYYTLMLRHSEYLGGAHGASLTRLQSFDLRTGNQIDFSGRFDMRVVGKEAEKRFRAANKLTPEADLNDAGFLFKDGKFALPENMGLTPDGLLLIYNSYEVASYAEGATRILIPYAAISGSV